MLLRIILHVFTLTLLLSATYAQSIVVSGEVRDQDTNEGLPGVTVIVQGTSTGTITDIDGKYSVEVNSESSGLKFSFVGFMDVEESINGRRIIDVKMNTDIQELSEVVVVGYGTVRKSELTSSISSVSSDVFENTILTSPLNALKGRAAGVVVKSATGEPGAAPNIRIRGVSTGGGMSSDPLIVLDNTPVSSEVFGTVNPDDIASIEVLKDASATAIYGSRGTNGVIMVTTKRGKERKASLNFSSYFGIQSVVQNMDLLDREEQIDLLRDKNLNAGIEPHWALDSLAGLGINNDWQDLLYNGLAVVQNYNLSASGGNKQMQYRVSGAYFSQEGIIKPSKFDRYSVRLNLDNNIGERIKLQTNLSGNRSLLVGVNSGSNAFNGGFVSSALGTPSILPIYSIDGTFQQNLFENAVDNPIALANGTEREVYKTSFLSNFQAHVSILESLVYTLNALANLDFTERNNFTNNRDTNLGRLSNGLASYQRGQNLNILHEHTITYNENFNDKHSITAMAGFSETSWRFQNQGASSTDFPLNAVPLVTGGSSPLPPEQSITERSLQSLLARAIYNYDNKYMITATVRRDGSSRFGPESRWGTFPSVSLGWVMSNESFFPSDGVFGYLKLRGSYGVTGNDGIPDYAYFGNYEGIEVVLTPGSLDLSYRPTQYFPNSSIKWESTYQVDIGLDAEFFSGRIVVAADYYRKRTDDLLFEDRLPVSYTRSRVFRNLGEILNEGFDFDITTRNLGQKSSLSWDTKFTLTYNRNEVNLLPSGVDPLILSHNPSNGRVSNLISVGHPINSFFGYEMNGLFQNISEVNTHATQTSQTAPGDVRFNDISGPNGVPDGLVNEFDRAIIGNPNPRFVLGFTNNLSFRQFDLMINMNGVIGMDIYNATRADLESMIWDRNGTARLANRWKAEGDNTDIPRAHKLDPNNNTRPSSRFVEKASYLKFRDIVLGYTLPSKLQSALSVQGLRVYLALNNYWTITDYKGFDPEVGGDNGVDYNPYPQSRTMMVGLNVNF